MQVVNSWACSVAPPDGAQSLWELLEWMAARLSTEKCGVIAGLIAITLGFNAGAMARLDWFMGERLVVIKLYTNAVVAYSLLGSI